MTIENYLDSREEERRIRRANAWRRRLGMQELRFEEESQAPPVQRDLLVALARGELREQQAGEVAELISRFHSWNYAYARVLLQMLEEPPP